MLLLFIHALWLIYFQLVCLKRFILTILLAIAKKGNKKHTKKERHNIIASLHTNEALNQPKTKLIGRRSNTNTMYMYVKSVINRFKTIDTIYIFRLRQCWWFS